MAKPKKEVTDAVKEVEVKETAKKEEAKASVVEKKQENVASDDNANLLNEIETLKAQLEMMMRAQTNTASIQETKAPKKKQMVKIISLVNGGLTLQGSRIIRIEKQFDSVTVTDAEARIIISNMPESARTGVFYIADNDFVEENGLDDAYETILNDSQLKTILSKNAKDVVEIYQNAPDTQKRIIKSMIIDGRLMGREIDANILDKLGKVSGTNFLEIEKIEDVAEDK